MSHSGKHGGTGAVMARIVRAVLAFQIALLGIAGLPAAAFADVRKADVVAGSTVADRGLTVAESPSIDAEHAALVDSDGNVYFMRAAEDEAQIASITKVMTAIVALDEADGDLQIVVSDAAAEIGESSAGLQAGDIMDLDTALKALLVPSGNDAAIALAETIGARMIASGESQSDDAVKAFVGAMNVKAHEIGCTDTVYENPHGLDDGDNAGDLHSTALDQAKVAQCAMTYQKIRDIVAGGSTAISVKRDGKNETVELETTDLLLEDYSAAIGIKTGHTDLAGPSFMGAASKDGRELYAVVLDSADEYQRFADAKELFEWYYDHVVDLGLANSSEYVTMRVNGQNDEVPVLAEVSHADWMDRTVKATLDDPAASLQVFDLDGNVSQELAFDDLHGTVNVGDKVGTITFYQHNAVVATHDLVACERVDGPNPIDALAIMWQRFTTGKDKADSEVLNVMPIINDNTTNAAG